MGHSNFTVLTAEEEEEFDSMCEVGDIRIGFETERMPNEVTIVGIQVGVIVKNSIIRSFYHSIILENHSYSFTYE